MLRLGDFKLERPKRLEDAVSILEEEPKALPLAGGTDLIPKLKRAQVSPKILVSLDGIEGLKEWGESNDCLTLGSMLTLSQMEEMEILKPFGSLYRALRVTATPIIRNMATLGGNLLQDTRCKNYDQSRFWRDALGNCLKTGGPLCRVAPGGSRCYATFCSDLAPAMAVLEAQIELVGNGNRRIPLRELYRDDGISHIKKGPHEIITQVIIPKRGYVSSYLKLRAREGFDFPEVGIAMSTKGTNKTLELRISMVGVSSGLFYFEGEEETSRIKKDPEGFAREIVKKIKPMDTLHFDPLYRKRVAERLLVKLLRELT
jgi:4-hydroxybenzoyl-CoA reductase subunit beta